MFQSKPSRQRSGIPENTRASVAQRLVQRQRDRWPQLHELRVRVRGSFAYVDAVMPDGELWQLFRLRYAGSASSWGFAVYLGSSDPYEDSVTAQRRLRSFP